MEDVSRRSFIKSAALVGGGLIFAPSVLKAQDANKKLNVGMIGYGAQGAILFENLQDLAPTINFKAICDIRPDKRITLKGLVRRKWGAFPNEYVDYKEMIEKEKELDAVFIATPDVWHSPMTCDCLKAGINVYCEKMMSNTKEGARKMVKAMKESGKLLQIGHQRKSNPRYIYAHDVLLRENNICGTLTSAVGQWNRSVTKDISIAPKLAEKIPDDYLQKYGYKDLKQFLNWRWYKGFGCGPISDLGSHQIDIFEWFFGGRPKSVMASGGVDFYKDKDWYDNVMCIFEYETYQKNIARAFYQVQTTTGAGGGYYEMFCGTEGAIKMSENPSITKVFKEGDAQLAEKWDGYVKKGIIRNSAPTGKAPDDPDPDPDMAVKDSRESGPLGEFRMPKNMNAKLRTRVPSDVKEIKAHMPHIVNFLDAVRGIAKLNCDGEMAFEAEAAVFKAIEAIDAKKTLAFEDSDFVA